MTQQEFIIKSLRPYFEEPLLCGISEHGGCSYRGRNGTKCALGQYIRDDAYTPEMEGKSAQMVFTRWSKDILTDAAKDMGLSGSVWDAIQRIHDALTGGDRSSVAIQIDSLEDRTGEPFPELYDLLNSL